MYVYKTLDELRSAELLPFRAGIDALTQAVEEGTIAQERLDESVLRVLRLKIDRGIIPTE